MKQIHAFVVGLSLFIAGAASAQPLLSPQELQAKLGDTNVRVIDIRDAKSYAANHIPGAVNAPYGQWRGPATNPGELPALPKLTKRFVDALKPVASDTLYRDADLKGFALRAKPSGARAWVVQYRNKAGRTRKLALGRVGVLTPDEARQRARKALGRVAGGEDPSAPRSAARGAMTVADLLPGVFTAAHMDRV